MTPLASYWTDLHAGLGILLFGGMMVAGVAAIALGAWREARNQDRTNGKRAGRTRTRE